MTTPTPEGRKVDREAIKAAITANVQRYVPTTSNGEKHGHYHWIGLDAAVDEILSLLNAGQAVPGWREVLQPFADLADAWERGDHRPPEHIPDSATVPGRWVKLGDLRRARAILNAATPEPDKAP